MRCKLYHIDTAHFIFVANKAYMYEKILQGLQTRFVGVPDKVLKKIATKLSKTTTEEGAIDDAVNGVTFGEVVAIAGDMRATEATATAVKNYETRHGLKDGQPVVTDDATPQGGGDKGGDNGGDLMAAILAKFEAMEQRLTALSNEKATAGYRAQLDDATKGMPEKIAAFVVKQFESQKFDTADAFDEWLVGMTDTFGGLTINPTDAPTPPQGGAGAPTNRGVINPPKGGATGGNEPKINEFVKARAEARAAANASTAIQGLQTK